MGTNIYDRARAEANRRYLEHLNSPGESIIDFVAHLLVDFHMSASYAINVGEVNDLGKQMLRGWLLEPADPVTVAFQALDTAETGGERLEILRSLYEAGRSVPDQGISSVLGQRLGETRRFD